MCPASKDAIVIAGVPGNESKATVRFMYRRCSDGT